MASSRSTRLLKISPSRCCDCPSVANRGSRLVGFDSISSVSEDRSALAVCEHPASVTNTQPQVTNATYDELQRATYARLQRTAIKQPTVLLTEACRRLFFFFAPAKKSARAAEGSLFDLSRKPLIPLISRVDISTY